MILTTVCYSVEKNQLLICFDIKTKLIYTVFNLMTLVFFIVVIFDMLIKKLKTYRTRNAVVPFNPCARAPAVPSALFINVRDPQVNIINIDRSYNNVGKDHIRYTQGVK